MKHEDITEVSDPREITLDDPAPAVPQIRVESGNPTDEELAALLVVLTGVMGHSGVCGPQEINLWGHPVDKLRYSMCSSQRTTLLERVHMRR